MDGVLVAFMAIFYTGRYDKICHYRVFRHVLKTLCPSDVHRGAGYSNGMPSDYTDNVCTYMELGI